MAKNEIKIAANVADTIRPTPAGAKRHPGWHAVRSVVERITTPLLPDDYLKLANPLWSARELRGRVVDVRRETFDSATLVIKPGWGFHFDYEPGQYVGIGVLMDGRWRWRSYSLTSTPVTRDKTITITVKAMPEGFLSSHLVGGVTPGTIVRLAAPQGNFVMPDPAPASVLFLTAGSGITPVMSMLRTLARRDQVGDSRARAFRADRVRRDVRRGTGSAARGTRGLSPDVAADAVRGPARPVQAGRPGARLANPPDVGVWARGHARRCAAHLGVGRRRRSFCIWSGSPHRARRRGAPAAPSPSSAVASPSRQTPRRH